MHRDIIQELLTLPNLLTCFRFFATPLLLWLAWSGHANYFLFLLAITFLSDVLDGMAARILKQQSDLGSILDSWADLMIYTTITISAWWLWPVVMQREIFFVVIIIISYLLPVSVGIIKFRAITSYHTWLVKIAVALTGSSFFLLFVFDLAWPFRITAFICLLAALEEILITVYLIELHSNVCSLWHVIKAYSR